MNRMGEVSKHLTDLLYYAAPKKHLSDAFLKLLNNVIDFIEKKDERYIRSFVRSFNNHIYTIWRAYRGREDVVETISKIEDLKMKRLGKYIPTVSTKEISRTAKELLSGLE